MIMDARQDSRIRHLQTRLERDPASLVFVPLADLLLQIGQVEKAVVILEEGLRHRPGHGPALVLLGRTRLGQDRPEEGVRLLRRALSAQPENPVALRLLVDHFLEAGAFTHAVPLLDTLVELEPEQSRWTEARHEARAALDAAPEMEAAPSPPPEGPQTEVPAAPAGRPEPVGDGDGMVTLTLVDIMIEQGYHHKALTALRRMEEQEPGREDVRQRIRLLEQRKSGTTPGVRSDLISSPDRAGERSRQKEQFGQWLQGFTRDGGEQP